MKYSAFKILSRMARKIRTISLPFLQSFLTCLGRFPFTKEKVKVEMEKRVWVFDIHSITSFPFHIVSSLVFLWLVVMLIGYITLWMNSSPQQPSTDILSLNCSFDGENTSNMTCTNAKMTFEEVNRTITFVVFFLMYLLNHTAQSLNMMCRGNLIAKFLTEWEEIAKEAGFKRTRGIILQMVVEVVYTCAMFAFVFYLEFGETDQENFSTTEKRTISAHFVRDTIKSVIIITLQPFSANFEKAAENKLANALSTMFMFYVYVSFKSVIFFYIYLCSSLSHMFKRWNKKAKRLFNEEHKQKGQLHQLADQHLKLVHLVQNMDSAFGLIITTYITSLVGIVIFTIHYFVSYLATLSTMSLWLFVVILAPSSVTLLNVALVASNVQREAMKGFESLRGATLKRHKQAEEREVLEALLVSFQVYYI